MGELELRGGILHVMYQLHPEGMLLLLLRADLHDTDAHEGRLHVELYTIPFAFAVKFVRQFASKAMVLRSRLHTASFVYDFHLRLLSRSLTSGETKSPFYTDLMRILQRLSSASCDFQARKSAVNALLAEAATVSWSPKPLTVPPNALALFKVLFEFSSEFALLRLPLPVDSNALAANLSHPVWRPAGVKVSSNVLLLLHLRQDDAMSTDKIQVHFYALSVTDPLRDSESPMNATALKEILRLAKERFAVLVERALLIFSRRALRTGLQSYFTPLPALATVDNSNLKSSRTIPALLPPTSAAVPPVPTPISPSGSLSSMTAFTRAHLQQLLTQCIVVPCKQIDSSLRALSSLAKLTTAQTRSISTFLARRFYPNLKSFHIASDSVEVKNEDLALVVPESDCFVYISLSDEGISINVCALQPLPPLPSSSALPAPSATPTSSSTSTPSSISLAIPQSPAFANVDIVDEVVTAKVSAIVNSISHWLWLSSLQSQGPF